MTITRRIFSQFAFLSRRESFKEDFYEISIVYSRRRFLNFFNGVIIIIFKATNERKVVACSLEDIRKREDRTKADAFTRRQSLKLNSSLSARDDGCQTIKRPSDLYAQLNFAGTWTGNAK